MMDAESLKIIVDGVVTVVFLAIMAIVIWRVL